MAAEAAEYRETQVLERKIKENPPLRDAWVKRQLQMELIERDLPEAENTALATRPEPWAEVVS